jgi:hypothetical protein
MEKSLSVKGSGCAARSIDARIIPQAPKQAGSRISFPQNRRWGWPQESFGSAVWT